MVLVLFVAIHFKENSSLITLHGYFGLTTNFEPWLGKTCRPHMLLKHTKIQLQLLSICTNRNQMQPSGHDTVTMLSQCQVSDRTVDMVPDWLTTNMGTVTK